MQVPYRTSSEPSLSKESSKRQRPAGDDERPAVRVSRHATTASTPEERLESVESVVCDSTSGFSPFPADSAAPTESFHVVDVELPEAHAELLRQKVDLAARLLVQVAEHNSERANGTASRPWVTYLASLSRGEAGRLAEHRNFQLPPHVPWLPTEDEDEPAAAAAAGRPRVDAATYRGRWSNTYYSCQLRRWLCRRGFYAATGDPFFNGSLVESAWREKVLFGRPTYDMLYVCKPCRPGCNECVDDSPCLSHYNWAFRISLLTISVICIVLTMVLAGYVYRYRKLKVIKVASPVFLCITLIGCAIMYCEVGGTILLLQLHVSRVSLTYRVKSAHKLKLTDKQLLQWLFPILLEMAIYLGTWTISSPPDGIYLKDWHGLKFKQCEYNWWDHTMAIGEFLFLLWGIRVCYNVRNAESFFNEAKHISWAIYNITIVNLIMMLIHLVILPSASPDVKYLFGFIRTQLSTTVTVILIFGPKFYRVIKGQGDMWDNRARARGVTASFSLNGVGLMHEETVDLYQENEELKEEIQKLAAQIEFMKIVHMEMNNRHLKPKHGGFFSSSSQGNSTQSPVVKAMCIKFDNTDSPGSRISPAAELVSERV
ncbi:hypothetical protein HPB52_013413 [Rhipicephalus sanguineus]|uniref:G-protein coupled receptors family 3 profile domain-containing protein n=1 Tax=Rhipicephalus sanguineus TaxID=34632 RepID=A0A9D4TA52_RHISA|nr:hypothetical protein HPB52_013413 [Rhipicephalus sanguineus]